MGFNLYRNILFLPNHKKSLDSPLYSRYGDDETDSDDQPFVQIDPNIFVYRHCGYSKMLENTVQFVSKNRDTKIQMEVYRFIYIYKNIPGVNISITIVCPILKNLINDKYP